jgi:hypothetical protein
MYLFTHRVFCLVMLRTDFSARKKTLEDSQQQQHYSHSQQVDVAAAAAAALPHVAPAPPTGPPSSSAGAAATESKDSSPAAVAPVPPVLLPAKDVDPFSVLVEEEMSALGSTNHTPHSHAVPAPVPAQPPPTTLS